MIIAGTVVGSAGTLLTQRNVAQLRADGVILLGPAAGDQACGEVGMGRMSEPEELLQGILARGRGLHRVVIHLEQGADVAQHSGFVIDQ
jgi:phosphopantothenoylcysteine synthetase/decarboxylase